MFKLHNTSSKSGYRKRRQAYCIQRTSVQGRKRVRKHKPNEFKVSTGWTQEWVSPDQLQRNTCVDVRDVVRGPFFSPRLLRTQPRIDRSNPDPNENINYARRGIPDAWREYLASRGHCAATEARVLQKNLISSYVRCLATDRLWNDLGLPFVQGIPDPWKSWSSRLRAVKRPRRRHSFRKNTIAQIVNNYDADDEAETEYSVARHTKCTKQYSGEMKDLPCTVQHESNLLPMDEETVQTDRTLKCVRKGKQNKIDHNSKSPIISRKNSNTTAARGKKISKEFDRNRPVTLERGSLVSDEKKPLKKVLSPSYMKMTAKKRVQTDLTEKGNDGVRTVQPRVLQNFVCCRCKLQDHIGPNVQHFSNYASLLNEADVSQRVLCKNCEDSYRGNNSRRGDLTTDIVNACEPIPKSCPGRRKITECGKIYKRTKLKFHGCVRKTKQQFEHFSCPRRMEGANLIDDRDLKLVCCRCDCPYLRIASPDPIERKTGGSDKPSGRTQRDRHIGQRERKRISKSVVTRKHGSNRNDSENRCKTRAENKACVPKRNLERPLHSTAARRSEAAKNVNKHPKSDDTSSSY
ncbi:uncharacterized protein LOC143359470 [Halictus rubicundus]|uniref:uncharacterized protein LOC143359470 n=1 Tax=Halictus rubicundus TaxID=77578 RepID=UPI004035C5B2